MRSLKGEGRGTGEGGGVHGQEAEGRDVGTAGGRVAGDGKGAPSVITPTCESATVEPITLSAKCLHSVNKTKPPTV